MLSPPESERIKRFSGLSKYYPMCGSLYEGGLSSNDPSIDEEDGVLAGGN
jgi:hypothetical protein